MNVVVICEFGHFRCFDYLPAVREQRSTSRFFAFRGRPPDKAPKSLLSSTAYFSNYAAMPIRWGFASSFPLRKLASCCSLTSNSFALRRPRNNS